MGIKARRKFKIIEMEENCIEGSGKLFEKLDLYENFLFFIIFYFQGVFY